MKKLVAVLCGVAMSGAVVANAAISLPESVPIAEVETLGGLALTGLAVIWGLRKLVKTINRS